MNEDGKTEVDAEPLPEGAGDDEARIRERAYLIWIEEGMPHGDHERHWHLARTLVMIEDAGGGLAASDEPVVAEPSATTAPMVAPAPVSVGEAPDRAGNDRPGGPQAADPQADDLRVAAKPRRGRRAGA